MDIEELKNEHETARILNMSVRTLQARRVQGDKDLPWIKIGRSVRYRASDIAHLIEKNLVHSTTESDARVKAK